MEGTTVILHDIPKMPTRRGQVDVSTGCRRDPAVLEKHIPMPVVYSWMGRSVGAWAPSTQHLYIYRATSA